MILGKLLIFQVGNFPAYKIKRPTLKKVLTFSEIGFSSSRLKKLLIFQEMKLSYFSSKKVFSYILGSEPF